MLLDHPDIQAPPGTNTRSETLERRSKPVGDDVERSGNGGAGEAPEAPPWYIANKSSASTANEWRRKRFERRQRSSDWLIRGARMEAGLPPVAAAGEGAKASEDGWIRPQRPARCRWRVAETVGVHHSGDLDTNAHFSGLERCASIWACPVCSAVIRAERATDIQSAVEKWQTDENHLVFVTLTMRHKRTDKLAVTLNAALKAWSKVTSGRAWLNFKNQFGVQGFVRAVEVTLGENGWHPHIHALLFTNKPMTADDQEALSSALFDRWVKYVTSLGGGMPSKLRGIDVRPATKDGKVVAQYLSKVQEKNLKPDQGIGKEMARFDFKTGRGLSMTPFELLDGSDNDENFIIMKLWNEYVAATKGRRAITWSQGLRDLVALEDERTDEEILEDTKEDDLQLLIPGQDWDRIKNKPLRLADILEYTEKGDLESVVTVIETALPVQWEPA